MGDDDSAGDCDCTVGSAGGAWSCARTGPTTIVNASVSNIIFARVVRRGTTLAEQSSVLFERTLDNHFKCEAAELN
jgi:hypothetical protein